MFTKFLGNKKSPYPIKGRRLAVPPFFLQNISNKMFNQQALKKITAKITVSTYLGCFKKITIQLLVYFAPCFIAKSLT